MSLCKEYTIVDASPSIALRPTYTSLVLTHAVSTIITIMEQLSPFSVNDKFGEGTLFQRNQNGTPNRNSRQILTCKPFLF